MAQKSRKFDLSAYPDLDIRSFEMRPAIGNDVLLAAERCAMGNAKVDENTFGLLLRNQMIAGAIVAYDDKRVPGASCTEYLNWTQRTREFVTRAYDFMNSATKDERESFQKLLEGGGESSSAPAQSGTTSSASG